MTSLRLRMLEDMQIRNLAVNTRESYVQQVSLFARYFNQSPERLGPEQIRTYQVYLTNEKRLATSSPIRKELVENWLKREIRHRSSPALLKKITAEILEKDLRSSKGWRDLSTCLGSHQFQKAL